MNRNELREIINEKKPVCICGRVLRGSGLEWYPHDGGIKLEEDAEPQWYYVKCAKCRYDVALWKIRRELEAVQWVKWI